MCNRGSLGAVLTVKGLTDGNAGCVKIVTMAIDVVCGTLGEDA